MCDSQLSPIQKPYFKASVTLHQNAFQNTLDQFRHDPHHQPLLNQSSHLPCPEPFELAALLLKPDPALLHRSLISNDAVPCFNENPVDFFFWHILGSAELKSLVTTGIALPVYLMRPAAMGLSPVDTAAFSADDL